MSSIDKSGVWVRICGSAFCILCRWAKQEIDGSIPYEFIDINDPKNKEYVDLYEIESIEDIPVVVVFNGENEIARTHVPLSVRRVQQIAEMHEKQE